MSKLPALSNVSSKYGAPMGRTNTHADDREAKLTFTIELIEWEDGDYDEGGAYWGSGGGPLFRAEVADPFVQLFIRASSPEAAMQSVREEYPNATFTEPKRIWWSSSSGRIELQLSRTLAESCSHQGQCDADVAAARELPEIKAQLDKIKPDVLRAELKEYGTWDAKELADHDANLDRLVWLAANDISEGQFDEEEDADEQD